jgi:hypothetical protein
VNRYAVAAADPLAHALIAAAVAAPLGRRAMLTAVIAGTLIDVDHPVAARSLRPSAMLTMPARPRSHTLLAAAAAGTGATLAAGPRHGWAAFAGLASHLLRDAGDDAAPTPLLWPLASPRQIGRRRAMAGIAALALGSWLVRTYAAGGGDTAPPRTA